ncbi:TRAP transporter small permease subunit [Paenisporosarcina sp. TG20]|uniref:TRAP transporter small permease subunit n=1 Tax=Paenisporosarcina sp. TG20 TaxID=1211706 RepID=UPI0002D919E2|nr:TRAP transporter small permease [Paenisporosarcina sp. TG20]
MEKFVRIIDKTSNAFGVLAGILMILSVVLVITEVIMRSAFDSTIYITSEYSAYFMVGVTFLGLAYTLKEKGHIRMAFLQKRFKGQKARLILDLYTFTVGLVLFSILTVATFQFFLDSLMTGSQSMQLSKTYLAIPQFALPLGSLLITLQFVSEIIKSIVKFRSGELGEDEDESQALGH